MEGRDGLLTVEQVARRLNVPRGWIYDHAGDWSFTRKLSRKRLRFEPEGFNEWLASQRPERGR